MVGIWTNLTAREYKKSFLDNDIMDGCSNKRRQLGYIDR